MDPNFQDEDFRDVNVEYLMELFTDATGGMPIIKQLKVAALILNGHSARHSIPQIRMSSQHMISCVMSFLS